MEKISGILKASNRVTSVDMKESAPIRPGTPSFGRIEGTSALRDRQAAVDTAEASASAHDTMMHWRTREGRSAKVVDDIANKFFSANRGEVLESISKAAPDRPQIGEADVSREPASDEAGPQSNPLREEIIPGEFYPKGSFIDAVA